MSRIPDPSWWSLEDFLRSPCCGFGLERVEVPSTVSISFSLLMFRPQARASTSHNDRSAGSIPEVRRHGKFGSRYPYRLSLSVSSFSPAPVNLDASLMINLLCCSYDQRPSEDLTLEEFEDFAIARLRRPSTVSSLLSSLALPFFSCWRIPAHLVV
jgi:hypothetical protein